jgi:hypothetical protein
MPPLDAGTPHSAVSGLLFRLSETRCLPVRGLGWLENVYDMMWYEEKKKVKKANTTVF